MLVWLSGKRQRILIIEKEKREKKQKCEPQQDP